MRRAPYYVMLATDEDVNVFSFAIREMRLRAGLSQHELGLKSGVHEKSISSFETGIRVSRMKLAQFAALVNACEMTWHRFADLLEEIRTSLRERRAA